MVMLSAGFNAVGDYLQPLHLKEYTALPTKAILGSPLTTGLAVPIYLALQSMKMAISLLVVMAVMKVFLYPWTMAIPGAFHNGMSVPDIGGIAINSIMYFLCLLIFSLGRVWIQIYTLGRQWRQ